MERLTVLNIYSIYIRCESLSAVSLSEKLLFGILYNLVINKNFDVIKVHFVKIVGQARHILSCRPNVGQILPRNGFRFLEFNLDLSSQVLHGGLRYIDDL